MTVIELVVSFSLTVIISLFLIQITLFLKDTYVINSIKSQLVLKQSLISDRINTLFKDNTLIDIDSCGRNCYNLKFYNKDNQILSFENDTRKIVIGDYVTTLPKGTTSSDIEFAVDEFKTNQETMVLFNIKIAMRNVLIPKEVYNVNVITEIKNKDMLFFNYENEFIYIGTEQEFIVPKTGYYKIELWGAQGGGNDIYKGGLGGYTSGIIQLNKGEKLYLYVGGEGKTTVENSGGYNGGGNGASSGFGDGTIDIYGGGGGATDIRLVSGLWNNDESLKSRIMVAAGGGGTFAHSENYIMLGGNAGSLIGNSGGLFWNNACIDSGGSSSYAAATGGTQTSGGLSANKFSPSYDGKFGIGMSGYNMVATGGGGGYYGGGGTENRDCSAQGGGAGSSFISGYAGVNAIASNGIHTNNTLHYSGKYFVDGNMLDGINEGNGKAKITYISFLKPKKQSEKLNNVRYIKNCVNGSSSNDLNAWNEIQAISKGFNVALNKPVYSTGTIVVSDDKNYSFSAAVDGDFTFDRKANATINETGLQCLTVDLTDSYDLDEIAIWHYWDDKRVYNLNSTFVSSDNKSWVDITVSSSEENSNGMRINPYKTPNEVKKYTLTNLISDSSFEKNNIGLVINQTLISGISNTSYLSFYGNNSLVSYKMEQYHGYQYDFEVSANHQYYAFNWIYSNKVGKIDGNEAVNYFDISMYYDDTEHWGSEYSSRLYEWHKISRIRISPKNSILKYKIGQTNANDNDSWFYTDGILLIDLTSIFGFGNEPSEEWCDENIPYFDGTITIYLNK